MKNEHWVLFIHKEDEIMSHAGKCVELDIIAVNEISQFHKYKLTRLLSYMESGRGERCVAEGNREKWLKNLQTYMEMLSWSAFLCSVNVSFLLFFF